MNQAQADKLISDLMDMTAESEDYGTWNTVKTLIQAAVTPDKPEAGETVRVRIAVVVRSDGDWASGGYSYTENGRHTSSDARAEEYAREGLPNSGEYVVHFIEADIPLPTSVTVEGTVVK